MPTKSDSVQQSAARVVTEALCETLDALYRDESRRIFATLVRLLGDFDLAEEALHDGFRAALEQWPSTGVPAHPMKLGLDLSGGVHFLLEVDMDKALDARLKVYEGDVKSLLRKEKLRYRSLPQLNGAIQLGFSDEDSREQARSLIRKNFNDFDIVPADLNGQPVLRLAM